MALKDRFGPGVQNNIAIWHLINDLWLLREADINMAEVVRRHQLDATETTELGSIFQQLNNKGNKREVDFMNTWQTLMSLERGVLSWEQAKTKLGVT